MKHWCFALLTAACCLRPALRPRAGQADDHLRQRSDSKGESVTGLTATDFAVKEDNVAREVLKAEPPPIR